MGLIQLTSWQSLVASPLAQGRVFLQFIPRVLLRLHPKTLNSQMSLDTELSYLGIARMTEMGLEQRVHPCLVKMDAPIGYIEDVFNGVVIEGTMLGPPC